MQDTREQILARASELYLTCGLAGLSMRKLAKEVGVTAPALYRYYEGRDALLADLVRQAYRVFLDYLRRGLEAPTPAERFASAAQSYFDFALEHPRWYAIMFSGPERLGMDALPEDIEAMGFAIHQFWNDRVNECMRAGVLKEGDPEDVSITMWAHAHGLVQLYQQGRLNTDVNGFRTLVEASSLRLFAGVVTDEYRTKMHEQGLGRPEMASGVTAHLGL